MRSAAVLRIAIDIHQTGKRKKALIGKNWRLLAAYHLFPIVEEFACMTLGTMGTSTDSH